MREIECRHLRAPARVIDIDIAIDYGDELIDVASFESMWCLVRNNGVAVAKRFLDVHGETTAALSELRAMLAGSNPPSCDTPERTSRDARDRLDPHGGDLHP